MLYFLLGVAIAVLLCVGNIYSFLGIAVLAVLCWVLRRHHRQTQQAHRREISSGWKWGS